jgi:hypothetical protein
MSSSGISEDLNFHLYIINKDVDNIIVVIHHLDAIV